MVYRLLYPATVQGRGRHFALVAYLSISIIGCTAPQKSVKPPAAIARAMETRSFAKDMITVLKAAINAVQFMGYTINGLNTDVGLLTDSHTCQQLKIYVYEEVTNTEGLSEWQKTRHDLIGHVSSQFIKY